MTANTNRNMDKKRRWLGVLALGAAALMVVAGQTFLESRLKGVGFLVYWLVCFVLTVFAIFLALLDIRIMRLRTRAEHRALFEETFRGLPGKEGETDDTRETS